MKRVTFAFASIAAAFCLETRAEWAFVSLLRGAPESKPDFQRVAFVGSAIVKQIDGKAERLCGIDCWTPLVRGMALKSGDLVRTTDGAMIIKINETQSFVKLAPHTILRLLSPDRLTKTGPSLAAAR